MKISLVDWKEKYPCHGISDIDFNADSCVFSSIMKSF